MSEPKPVVRRMWVKHKGGCPRCDSGGNCPRGLIPELVVPHGGGPRFRTGVEKGPGESTLGVLGGNGGFKLGVQFRKFGTEEGEVPEGKFHKMRVPRLRGKSKRPKSV